MFLLLRDLPWYYYEEGILFPVILIGFFLICLMGQVAFWEQVEDNRYHRLKVSQKDKKNVWRESGGEAVACPSEPALIGRKRREGSRQNISWMEVEKHRNVGDVWIVVDGKVFDVSKFVEKHPGGIRPILAMAGRDATDAMTEFHPAKVFETFLPAFYIGDVEEDKTTELVKDFRAVRQDLLARGLFRTNMTYYYVKYLWLLSIFLPTLYGVLVCSSTTAHMLSALGMALFWQQLAFVGHDLGHSAVSHHRSIDFFYGGLIGNFLGGIGLSWWKNSHETHHVTCNSIEMDPDIQHLPFLAIHEEIIKKSFFSTYHLKLFEVDSVSRLLLRYQHIFFYPIMLFARYNLYAQSWIMLLFRKDRVPNKMLDIISLTGFWVWLFLFLSYLPSWQERVAYMLISNGAAGILHIQITLSHFISEVHHGRSEKTWLEHQMKTTTNISCSKYMDWFHGGLQFQLEHHLFPRLPRHNLRIARKRIIELSAKHNLPYSETDFLSANLTLCKNLRRIACKVPESDKPVSSFFLSPLWEGFNAIG